MGALRRLTHAPLTGTKEKLTAKAEGPVTDRTPLDADTFRSLIGAVLLFLSGRRIFRAVRAALRG